MANVPSLTRTALAGVGTFVALVALEHPLRPDLPARAHFVSEYASGSTDLLARGAFVAWGVATGAVAALAARRRMPAVAALGAVATAGCALCAAFATQTVAGVLPAGVERTTTGQLHDLGTLLVLVGLTGGALGSLWRLRRAGYRWALGGLAVVLVAAPAVLVGAGLDWPGIGQRAIIAVGAAWTALAAVELGRRERVRAPRRARRTPAPARA